MEKKLEITSQKNDKEQVFIVLLVTSLALLTVLWGQELLLVQTQREVGACSATIPAQG